MIRRRTAIAASAVLSLALAACDSAAVEAPGAVSQGEAEALDDAAEMLDEQRLPDGVIPAEPAEDDAGGGAAVPDQATVAADQ